MNKDLLLEIGVEELPASYMDKGADSFRGKIMSLLDENNILHGDIRAFVSPRRLVVHVSGLAECEKDRIEALTGPPRAVCEKDGATTKAYDKFIEKYGLSPSDVRWEKNERGEYLAADVHVKGRVTVDLITGEFKNILSSIDFPKRMRWDGSGLSFARPIRWITALYGDKIVPLEAAGVRAGRTTRFLRNSGTTSGDVADAADYFKKLKDNGIVASRDERKAMIEKGLKDAMAETGADSFYSAELIDEVANLVEYPSVLKGVFDEKYLALPSCVISAAMSQHQRYFSLYKDGEIMPVFVFVANGMYEDPSSIIYGNEMVLRARLDDAMFYWDADTSKTPDELYDMLGSITWMDGLGSLRLKTERVRQIASVISKDDPVVLEAARYAKIDIPSEMIKDGKEFTKLQGTIARYYLLKHGADKSVADAVEQHYWPKVWGDILPDARGAVVSIADKIDNITGAFIKGFIPSGTKDPYALRRQANSIIAMILGYENGTVDFSKGLDVKSVEGLFETCANLYPGEVLATEKTPELLSQINAFFDDRVRMQLKTLDMPYDIVDAVCDTPEKDMRVRYEKALAFRKLSEKAEFREVASTFRRVNNIVKKARESVDPDRLKTDESKFTESETRDMHEAWLSTASAIDDAGNDYEKVFDTILEFKSYVDRFFDAVMVMDKDPGLRDNRLALLNEISGRFGRLVNFDHIVVG